MKLTPPSLNLAALVLTVWPLAAQAEDPPLTAEAFEQIVEGKTWDTHDQTGLYGVETFLPGRRAIWRDDEQCLEGTWRVEGDLICFDYRDVPTPFCWTYHDRDGWLEAWYEGDRSEDPIKLYSSENVVTCEGFLGV